MADETKKIIVDISLNDNDYAKAAANAKKATLDLKKQIDELSKSEGDNSQEIAKLTAQMKNQQAEYNNNIKSLQNYEKGVKNANNSYDSLLAQWKLADVELKKLEGTLQLNEDGTISMSKAYLDAQENVKNAKDAINSFGKGVSDGRMSVGLYEDAIMEAVKKIEMLKNQQQDTAKKMEQYKLDPHYDQTVYDAIIIEYEDIQKELENTNKQLNSYNSNVKLIANSTDNTSMTLSDMKNNLKLIKKEMETIDVGSERFETLRLKAADLDLEIGQVTGKLDEFGDKEPKNPAKKGFEDLTEAAGAAAVATQLSTLIFGENTDAAEASAKALKAVALIEGIKQLTQAKGAIIDTVNLGITKARILQTTILTGVQAAYNAVMSAGIPGIGLFVAGVGAAIVGIVALAKNLQFASKEQKLSNEITKEATKAASDELTEMNLLVAQVKDARTGRGDLNKAIEEYNKKYGETGELTRESVMNEAALNKIIERQTKLIKKRYEAEAYAEKIKELNKQNIEIQQEGVAWYEKTWNSIKNGNDVMATNIANEKSKGSAIADNNKLIDFATKKYTELTRVTAADTQAAKNSAQAIRERNVTFKEMMDAMTSKNFTAYQKLNADYDKDLKEFEKTVKEKGGYALDFIKLKEQLDANYEIEYRKIQYDNFIKWRDIQRKKIDTQFELESMILDLRKDTEEKALQQAELTYRKEQEIIQRRIKDEPANAEILGKQLNVITEKYAQDQATIKEKYSKEAFDKEIARQQEEINLKLEIVKEGSQAELDLQKQQLEKQMEIDIEAAEVTGVDVNLIKEKYKQQELELEKEYNQKIYEQTISDMQALNEAELLQIEIKGGDVTAKKLEQAMKEKETLMQFEDESNAEYLLRQEELNYKIYELQKQQLDNRINNINQQTELIGAFNDAWVAGVDLLNSKSAESAEFQKTMALINIGVQTANALAQIVAIATSPLDPTNLLSGGLAAPIKILSLSGVVLSNMANAKKMLSAKPKGFASGVIDLQGPGTTTSDSIPAYLSKGESVMTAKATQIFKPQLKSMNSFANGIVDINSPTSQSFATNVSMSLMASNQLAEALKNMPAPIMDYKEFTLFQEKVVTLQQRAEL